VKVEIGQRVIEERNKRGWTQADLAVKSGLSQARVSEVENATRDYRFDTIERILKVLKLTLVTK
jgi:transcriptional regulator with XRE-family HTH domain